MKEANFLEVFTMNRMIMKSTCCILQSTLVVCVLTKDRYIVLRRTTVVSVNFLQCHASISQSQKIKSCKNLFFLI